MGVMAPKKKPQEDPGFVLGMAQTRLVMERIGVVMKTAGMTQTDVADATGQRVKQGELSKLLKGQRALSRDKLYVLVDALKLDLAQLLKGTFDDGALEGIGSPPEGVEGFLERQRVALSITDKEAWYLRQSRFKAEPWRVQDDKFWLKMLKFWREYLLENP